jgi:2-polyprenyl-3-methyl-5-hydroxy-6-metoxy-1,4-benzoquinol methylase
MLRKRGDGSMNSDVAAQMKDFSQLWGGFRASRVILTANTYAIFEHLRTPRTAVQIAAAIGTDPRATEILLDAVTSLGLLGKTGNRYRNTPMARRFLLKDSTLYQGDMLRHAESLWKSWSGLDEVVKSGLPHRAGVRDHEAFIRAMHNNAVLRAPEVIRALDLRGVKRALDLGGGPGTYSMALARTGISVTLFDLPNTVDIAKKLVRESGIKAIDFRSGDFHADDIGKGYDLVFISQIFHSFSQEENRALIEKSRQALNPGGKIAIQEFLLEKNRAFPVSGALFSVNMLVNTASGRCYTPQEMKDWLARAGFKGITTKRVNETVLLAGRTG